MLLMGIPNCVLQVLLKRLLSSLYEQLSDMKLGHNSVEKSAEKSKTSLYS